MRRKLLSSCFIFLLLCNLIGIKSDAPSAMATTEEARAECVIELHSLRILLQKSGDTRLPMASTTKIVTAITVLEQEKNLDRLVSVPPEAASVEGSSVYLKEGTQWTVRDLLYGLMLRSGNDCAVTLALSQAENIAAFSSKMNETAQKAGAIHSRFRNPHGLPCENHYTTALDLSYITAYALKNPIFAEIVATKYYAPHNWTNKNKLLTRYEGTIGVKTGYTKEAGRCLVTAATKNGLTLICTVLHCYAMYERTEKLLDDCFASYENHLLIGANEQVNVCVNGKTLATTTREDVFYPLLKEESERLKRVVTPLEGREKEGIIGKIEIFLLKRLLFSGNLYKL